MIICTTIDQLRNQVREARTQGAKIGLVPTMGALHEGHGALIRTSAEHGDFTVVSVFVNPTQFAPTEDLDQYPRNLESDICLAQNCGAKVLFHPTAAQMYPGAAPTWVEAMGSVTQVLCGQSRPIHFRGVTTVVAKLFNIVKPDYAYFGQKDAQQVQVLKKMVQDLFFDLELVVVPIVREPDGLAKSSRNVYLSPEQRAAAPILHDSLVLAQQQWAEGLRNAAELEQAVTAKIQTSPLAKIDYVKIYALPELTECTQPMQGANLLALAVYFGNTRLIDNIVLEDK